MKAAVVFTGSSPILILTSLGRLDDPDLVARLAAKGIGKFIAYEVPVDVAQDDGLRILDVDGQHIFCHLHLSDLGEAVRCESSLTAAGA